MAGQSSGHLPRRPVERMALGFYASLTGVAILWRSVWLDEPILFASEAAAAGGVEPLRDVAAGLVAAAGVIAASWWLTRATAGGERLARALAELLGRLTPSSVALLALASGIGEEAFFRGALQPRVGLVAASILFGLAHFVPRREFLPWTGFSLLAGLLLGSLFEATGNLVAPMVAHATINGVNLHMLSSRYASDPVERA